MRKKYQSPLDLPQVLPVFPLSGSLLLPRVQVPLNIFENQYLAMVDAALSENRLIGMVQPDASHNLLPDGRNRLNKTGCAGRITSYTETDDGRLLITLTGLCRFEIKQEVDVNTPFRQVMPDFRPYEADLVQGYDNDTVNRDGVLRVVRDYLDAHNLDIDWDNINNSSNEELVNSLSVISPFGAIEKQALLEAKTLSQRADIFIAFAELVLAQTSGENTQLQ